MFVLVPMHRNTSSALINLGYQPWVVVANQGLGVLLVLCPWVPLLGLHCFNTPSQETS